MEAWFRFLFGEEVVSLLVTLHKLRVLDSVNEEFHTIASMESKGSQG